MTNSANPQETVSFQRRPDLPGVEVRTVDDSAYTWDSYSTGFEFLTPTTWRGMIWHRQNERVLEPGQVLCAHPGEVVSARRVLAVGAHSSISIDPRVLAEHAAEHGVGLSELRLLSFAPMSANMGERFFDLVGALRPGTTSTALRSSLVEFVAALVDELLEDSVPPSSRVSVIRRVGERVRDCLHQDGSLRTDLTTLAEQTGMSRFQALRAFKRRYGLPPHAYQLRVRLGLAQKSLREGLQPARVAAEFGFTDQSHMTRHFKRVLGVTPAQYARIGAA
jgi:AraC-like DNA-binding protein